MRIAWAQLSVRANTNAERRTEPATGFHKSQALTTYKCVRRCGHWLECDVIGVLGREDLRIREALKKLYEDAATGTGDAECRALAS